MCARIHVRIIRLCTHLYVHTTTAYVEHKYKRAECSGSIQYKPKLCNVQHDMNALGRVV